jgi:hypothetical protein
VEASVTSDDEIRELERTVETDPGAASRLAFAYARVGRLEDAARIALNAAARSPDDPARQLIPPGRPSMAHDEARLNVSVPWSGLRTLSRAREASFAFADRLSSYPLHDAGRGVVLVPFDGGVGVLDVIRAEFLEPPIDEVIPFLTLPSGVVAFRRAERILLDPLTRAARPFPAEVQLRSLAAPIDDGAFVSEQEPGVVVFDAASGRILAQCAIEEPVRNLVVDPGGFTIDVGDQARSYSRSGLMRWSSDEQPIGACDGRCFLTGRGHMVVRSTETGRVEETLRAFGSEHFLVTRDVIIFVGSSLWAFDRATLDRLWDRDIAEGDDVASTADALLIFEAYGGGRLMSLDPRTGTLLSSLELGRTAALGMIPSGGKLVVPARTGNGVVIVE